MIKTQMPPTTGECGCTGKSPNVTEGKQKSDVDPKLAGHHAAFAQQERQQNVKPQQDR